MTLSLSHFHSRVRGPPFSAVKLRLMQSVYGSSALHLAATYGSDKMMSDLLDAGAAPQQTRKNGEDPKKILTRFHERDWDSIEMD